MLWIVIKKIKDGRLHIKFAKFLLVGGLAAITEYGSFLFFIGPLRLQVIIANVVSFCLGLLVSFSLNRSWVFIVMEEAKKQFVRYLVLALINLCISTFSIWVLTEEVGMPAAYGKVVMMVVIAVWNFVIFSKFIFKIKKED